MEPRPGTVRERWRPLRPQPLPAAVVAAAWAARTAKRAIRARARVRLAGAVAAAGADVAAVVVAAAAVVVVAAVAAVGADAAGPGPRRSILSLAAFCCGHC